jgi:hypothetical protein
MLLVISVLIGVLRSLGCGRGCCGMVSYVSDPHPSSSDTGSKACTALEGAPPAASRTVWFAAAGGRV